MVRHIFCVFPHRPPPFGYGALWDSKAPRWHTCERVSYCVDTSFSRLPVQDGSLSVRPLSLLLSFVFCPISFWRDWAAFPAVWYPLPTFRSCFVEVAQHSNDLPVNLWGRKWSSCPIPPPSSDHSQPNTSSLKGPHTLNPAPFFLVWLLGLVKLQPPGIPSSFSNLPLFLQVIYYFFAHYAVSAWSLGVLSTSYLCLLNFYSSLGITWDIIFSTESSLNKVSVSPGFPGTDLDCAWWRPISECLFLMPSFTLTRVPFWMIHYFIVISLNV